jgi:predicted Zn-dependent peptidase
MSYRPSIDPRDVRQRAALSVYSTLLGGSMGSRLFDEIREQRGLAYSVYSLDHAFRDVPILQLSAGLESAKCVEAYTRMREIVEELRAEGPRTEEFERARAYSAGRRVLAFENSNAVARFAATQTVVFGEPVDPDAAIAVLDEVTIEQVREIAEGISESLAVACVGPHTSEDFAS